MAKPEWVRSAQFSRNPVAVPYSCRRTGPHDSGDGCPVEIKPEQVIGQLLALPLKLDLLFPQLSHRLGSGNELIAEVLGSDG
jgi:hypothetical protein